MIRCPVHPATVWCIALAPPDQSGCGSGRLGMAEVFSGLPSNPRPNPHKVTWSMPAPHRHTELLTPLQYQEDVASHREPAKKLARIDRSGTTLKQSALCIQHCDEMAMSPFWMQSQSPPQIPSMGSAWPRCFQFFEFCWSVSHIVNVGLLETPQTLNP